MLIHGDGVFLFGDVGGGQFGQHIHYQFFVGHVVAKVLLAKALEALEISERLLDAEFRVLHLMDAVCSYLCEPHLERLCLGRWDTLDKP